MKRDRIVFGILLVVFVAILAILPLGIKKDSTINLLVLIFLFVVLASGWNILGGFTGQTNLGYAAFFGLGSLATRFLWIMGWPFIPSFLAGGVVAVVFALLIGAPAFKLRGAYFAIGTLALAQILNVTVGNVLPEMSYNPDLSNYQLVPRYYLFLGLAVLTVVTAYLIFHSKVGLGMMAVKEEEDAAESLGVSALKHKLLALGISACFAGLAGGAFAYYHVSYYYNFPFSPLWTFDTVTMVFVGGTGTILGPIIGAIFFVLLKEYLVLNIGEYHLIVFGVLFILVVLFLPGGLVEVWNKIQRIFPRFWRARKSMLPNKKKD